MRTRRPSLPLPDASGSGFFSYITTRPVFEEGPMGSCALFNSFPRAEATSNYSHYSNNWAMVARQMGHSLLLGFRHYTFCFHFSRPLQRTRIFSHPHHLMSTLSSKSKRVKIYFHLENFSSLCFRSLTSVGRPVVSPAQAWSSVRQRDCGSHTW